MTYNWLFFHQAVWRWWGPMGRLATHHVLQNGSILWELLKNVRGGSWRKPKHRHPTVVVVIFTCQILTESENNALIANNRLWSISSLISLIPRPSLITCSMQGRRCYHVICGTGITCRHTAFCISYEDETSTDGEHQAYILQSNPKPEAGMTLEWGSSLTT